MKIITILVTILVIAFARAEAPSRGVKVMGMVQAPQSVLIEGPTTLMKLVEQCGGVNRVWSGAITITRKESETQTVTRKHELQKRSNTDELKKFLTNIIIEPGDVVYFSEYN